MKDGFKLGLIVGLWSFPIGCVGVACMIVPPVGLCVLWAAAYPIARILKQRNIEAAEREAADEPLMEEGHVVKPWDISPDPDIDADEWDIIEHRGGRNAE